jgi:hypothetical protein
MNEQLLNKFLETLKEEFSENKEEILQGLQEWGKIILQIKKDALTAKTEEDKNRLLKTEQYAWAGINTLKTRQHLHLQKNAWVFVEKSLVLLKKVILT